MTLPTFYADQPEPVAAVIDLASMREHGSDPAHDRVIRLLLPAHADTIREIADALHWIDRLETELAGIVLSSYFETPIRGPHLDRVADGLAAEKRADVLLSAQLVASVVTGRERAA